jgi:tetratricopeptide (TPR) repeat protein
MFTRNISFIVCVVAILGCQTAVAQPSRDLQSAVAAHKYEEAISIADRGLSQDPNDPRLWFGRGLALGATGRTRESLSSLDNALRFSPNSLPILRAAAEIAYKAHDFSAKGYLARILDREPLDGVANGMMAVIYCEQADCPHAIDHFEKAGTALTGNTSAEMRYGSCLNRVGRWQEAATLFAQIVQANPGVPELLYDEALIYYGAKRYAVTIRLLVSSKKKGKDLNAESLNLLGAAYSDNGQIEESIASYREGLKRYPHFVQNYMDLASLGVQHQSFDMALNVLDLGIYNEPKSAELYTMRGAVRAQVGQNDRATADFESASRVAPSKLYGTVGLGTLLRDSTKLTEAETLLRAALKSSPNDGVLNYLLADVIVRAGAVAGQERFAESRALLKRAVELNPELAPAHAELGKLYLSDNKIEAAIHELESGLEYDATDRMSLYQLVIAYERAGRREDAKRITALLSKEVNADRLAEGKRNSVELVVVNPSSEGSAPTPR